MGNFAEDSFNICFQADSTQVVQNAGDSTTKLVHLKDSPVVKKKEQRIEHLDSSKATSVVQSKYKPVFETPQTSYANDTIFELPTVGDFGSTLQGSVFLVENYSNNLFKGATPLVSKRQSYSFNEFSGRVFTEVAGKENNTMLSAGKPIKHFVFNSWLLFILIITLSASMILFRRYFQKYFGLILLSAINIREAERFFDSKTSLYQRILFITNSLLIGSICLAVFNYLTLVSDTFDSSVKSFLIIALVVIAYLGYRNILLSSFAVVSDLRDFFSSLSFHHFVFNFIITLFLLFFGVLSTYLPFEFRILPLYGSLIIASMLLIMRALRSLRLFILHRFSIFYWFLYFCALELMPLAFLFYGLKRLVIIA
ncbi:DUF4271 domain-containing protein [Williamwhitmania taraxaci]|uniref:DUF4271 domain-containing protein n=1 Tax=Williamwhitmania taraxaci TaxID=1640674 RepID=A0A1G6GXW8_9BACT|nr:DUF4271 domain-containing protein [Williamwhitmania taraxaci]SDB86862.1 protein of unknown function [Williamwhitmania taraxaci]